MRSPSGLSSWPSGDAFGASSRFARSAVLFLVIRLVKEGCSGGVSTFSWPRERSSVPFISFPATTKVDALDAASGDVSTSGVDNAISETCDGWEQESCIASVNGMALSIQPAD